MSEFKIEPYSNDIAESLAQMWNESDDQWPGTFTRGVPMTAKRITKWMSEVDYMMNLVVKNGNGKIVGYGNLRDTPNQTGDSCYVPLLNVHPKYQGKSLCRRMLNQMVDYATAHGYQRMTIGTWSGNLKSVPLYKKVGFFWKPGMTVQMENYIPAVRQLPFAQSFFANADWYADFKRELAQVEDDHRHPRTGDMKVYICRWEKDGDFIEAVIDREGQSITGVETPRFAVHAVVDDSYPAQGFRYGISWCLENRQAVPITLTLQVSSDEGIDISFHQTITLAPGEKRRLESSFVCTTDAPPVDFDERWEITPRPRIYTQVTMDKQTFSLGTGLCYQPAVEISVEPEVLSLMPGQERAALIQLKNRVKRPFSGTLLLQPDDNITTNWETHDFDIKAEGFAAIPITISSSQSGGYLLNIKAALPDGADVVETAPLETAVLCTHPGAVVGVETEQKLIIENDFFLATALQKGGRVKVWDKVGNKEQMFFREEVGPPFDPHDLEQKLYDLSLHRHDGSLTAIFRVNSDRFAGLAVTRELLFTPTPTMRVTHRLQNNGDQPITCTIMTRLGMNDTNHGNGRSYIPYPDRLVSDFTSKYPVQFEDFPEKPEDTTEQWAVFTVDEQVHGVVWTTASKHNLRWGLIDIHSREVNLNAGEQIVLEPVYPYCGSGSWEDVRRLWQRIANQPDKTQPTPQPPYDITLEPSPILTIADTVDTTLQAANVRKQALNGKVKLALPNDWHTDQQTFTLDNLAQGNTFTQPVTLTAPASVGPAMGQLHLETPATNETFAIPMIRLGNHRKTVEVLQGEGEDGKPLLTMRNGRCSWVLAPDYHAGVIAWRDGTGENHLLTRYPDPHAAFAAFTPFHGGIQPMLPHRKSGDWLGKLYNEQFTFATINAPDVRGLPWRGVQMISRLQREPFRGLRTEIEYLTLPGSNVLKTVFRMVNETAVYRHAQLRFQDYFQVDGVYEDTVMVDQERMRKRVKEDYWEFHPTPWMAAVNPETGRCIVTVKASGRREIFLHDLGPFGGHLWVLDEANLQPHGSHELITYLALAESLEIGKQYAALAK